MLSNNVKTSVFQTIQQYYIVPSVKREWHNKFNHRSKEVKQLKHFCEY